MIFKYENDTNYQDEPDTLIVNFIRFTEVMIKKEIFSVILSIEEQES